MIKANGERKERRWEGKEQVKSAPALWHDANDCGARSSTLLLLFSFQGPRVAETENTSGEGPFKSYYATNCLWLCCTILYLFKSILFAHTQQWWCGSLSATEHSCDLGILYSLFLGEKDA